jgi:hypothetical protein
MELNNRELATAFWIVLFGYWLFSKGDNKKLLLGLLRILASRPLLIVNGTILAVGICIHLVFEILSPWPLVPYKNFAYWVLGTGIVASYHVATEGKSALSDFASNTFRFFLIFEFLVNIRTFSIWGELILVPVANFIVLAAAIAEFKPELKHARKLFSGLQIGLGVVVTSLLTAGLLQTWPSIMSENNLRDLVYPVALSILFAPFLYGFYIYSRYERLFAQILIRRDDRDIARYLIFRAFRSFGFDVETAHRWWSVCVTEQAKELPEAIGLMVEVKERKKREENGSPVPFEEGFSLRAAMHFLEDFGLTISRYDRCFDDKWQGSVFRSLTEEGVSNSLSYRISGTKNVVAELELSLDVRWPDKSDANIELFTHVAAAHVCAGYEKTPF